MNKMIKYAELAMSNTLHYHLCGSIYNDKRFPDGYYIKTSRIIRFYRKNGMVYAETKHNTYEIDPYTSRISPEVIDEYII